MDGMKGVAGNRRGNQSLKIERESFGECYYIELKNWYNIDSRWEL